MNDSTQKTSPGNHPPEISWLATGAAVIFTLSLLLRLVHVLCMRHSLFFTHPIQDECTYDQFARTAAEMGDWAGKGAFYQAPLYQYFLAVLYKLFGHGYLMPRLVQAFIDSLSAGGIFLIGARFFSKRTGIIAGIGAALYSQFIFNTGTLLPPTITLFLDVACSASCSPYRKECARNPLPGGSVVKQCLPWIVPGMLFGFQALAATNILALAPLFCAWIFWGVPNGRKSRPPLNHPR